MASNRDKDIEMLNDLIDRHTDELTDVETEAFAGMRFDLTAYSGTGYHEQLTDRQRDWVESVYQRLVPEYANLASRGLVSRGTPTSGSKALDAMLAAPKVARPPPIPKPEGRARTSRRHCGRNDEGCYAFVNGDCTCGCCS